MDQDFEWKLANNITWVTFDPNLKQPKIEKFTQNFKCNFLSLMDAFIQLLALNVFTLIGFFQKLILM